jgi:hypothetical protein
MHHVERAELGDLRQFLDNAMGIRGNDVNRRQVIPHVGNSDCASPIRDAEARGQVTIMFGHCPPSRI